jgi:hypothetical protein
VDDAQKHLGEYKGYDDTMALLPATIRKIFQVYDPRKWTMDRSPRRCFLLLYKLVVQHRHLKRSPLGTILGQSNSVHILRTHFAFILILFSYLHLGLALTKILVFSKRGVSSAHLGEIPFN